MERQVKFYTGCYSQTLGDMQGNGTGICSVTLNTATGALAEPICVAPCINPSYLAWGSDKKTLYATSEVVRPDTPALMSFTTNNDPQLTPLNTVELEGECPCHISVDPVHRLLASAQYGSGDIAVFSLADNGSIGQLSNSIRHSGQGKDVVRQEGPHAHYATFFDNNLVAVDLGIDAVLGYPINLEDGSINETPHRKIQTQPAAGPRHLAEVHGSNAAFVLCELSEEIYQVRLDDEQWSVVDIVPAFNNRHSSSGAAAAIKLSPDQRHLYASGRHQSVIACFEVEQTTGQLSSVGEVDTGGTGPRDFSLSPDGDYLIVANQITNTLVSFKRDIESGCLEPSGYSVSSGSPVCVLF